MFTPTDSHTAHESFDSSLPIIQSDVSSAVQSRDTGCAERLANLRLSETIQRLMQSELKLDSTSEAVVANAVAEIVIDIAADLGRQCGMEKFANQFSKTLAARFRRKLPDRIRGV